MKIEPLPWETGILGKKAGRVDEFDPNGPDAADFGDYAFLCAKRPAGDEAGVGALVRAGFALVETALILRRGEGGSDAPTAPDVTIALADEPENRVLPDAVVGYQHPAGVDLRQAQPLLARRTAAASRSAVVGELVDRQRWPLTPRADQPEVARHCRRAHCQARVDRQAR